MSEVVNLSVALPAVLLALGTCFLLIADVYLPENRERWTPIAAISLLVATLIITLFVYEPANSSSFSGLFVADPFTSFVNIIVVMTAVISIMLSYDYLKRTRAKATGEFYALVLLSSAGVMFMASANDLIVVFIALELLSIPLYILAAFRATSTDVDEKLLSKSEESGMKYFILGAFASAFFVYGAALIYGATGSTRFPEIFASASSIMGSDTSATFLLLTGSALTIVGLGFKVAVVPFHMWTPDVYEGAPTPVTAYMSVAAKVGGFAALLRLFVIGLSSFQLETADVAVWQNTVWIISALTLIVGNTLAISQTNIKRMLAYSSIAHAGYILMAVAASGTPGVENFSIQAALVYLIAYMFTNLGAFGVVIALEKADGTGTELEDFAGLARSRPILAAAMAVFMLSLTGIPLTGGFVGKLLVFQAAVQADLIPLAIIAALTSIIGAFYYVRVIVQMYQRTESAGDEAAGATSYLRWAVYASLAGTFVTGILPLLVMNLVNMIQVI